MKMILLHIILLTLLYQQLSAIHVATTCGRAKIASRVTFTGLVVDGAESLPGEWPWHAALFRKKTKYFCGASLISEQHLLTAAHCFEGYGINYQLSDYHAILGRFNISDSSEKFWIERAIASVTLHEEFDQLAEAYKSNADLAVLRLGQKVDFTDYIRPVCLPSADVKSAGVLGTVVGYGYSRPERHHEMTPQQGALKTISYVQCLFKDPNYAYIVSERSFCGGESDAAPCRGDSGGGFFVKDGRTGQFATYGVVSQGLNRFDCQPKDYVVFVDVSRFIDWINAALSQISTAITTPPRTDPCLASPCGPNSECTNHNGFGFCACLEDFIGNPPNCRLPECSYDSDCRSDHACLNQKCTDMCQAQSCGPSTSCEVKNHRRVCKCEAGFRYSRKNKCEPNPYLVDGEVKEYHCCRWPGDDYPIDITVQTFEIKPGEKILSSDVEVDPRHKSDIIGQFNIANWCENYRIGCYDRGNIVALPVRVGELFPNIVAYYAKYYGVQRLRRENFENMPKLLYLGIYDNLLDTIDADAFEDLTELTYVDFSENKLGALSPAVFSKNHKIQRINLYSNRIAVVIPQHFAHLTALTHISLCGNKLTALSVNQFVNHENLKELLLCTNELVSLPAGVFDRLPKLAILNLNNNELKTLDAGIFGRNTKLRKVQIGNKISKLSARLFENKPDLSYVDLRSNVCINKEYGDAELTATLTEAQKTQLRSDITTECA